MQQWIADLNHPELRQRLEAAAQLMNGGQQSIDPLLAALNHEEVEIRWRAAAALGWIGDPRVIPALAQRGDGEGYEGKFNIVWALGQIGDAAAIQPLLAIVHAGDDESPDIRYNAALALARLGQADTLRQSLEGSPEAVYRVAHAALAAYEYIITRFDSL
ncbi:MAG: HEAT repeat domain-containing protein [Chloroflexota bacterium]